MRCAVGLVVFAVSLALCPRDASAGGIRNPGLLIVTIPLISTTAFVLIYSLFKEPKNQETKSQMDLLSLQQNPTTYLYAPDTFLRPWQPGSLTLQR